MNRKLIFLDIDGTLTTPGSNVPPDSALEAIRAAQEAGAVLALFGHTHHPCLERREGITFLNPGTIGRVAHPSYAVLSVEEGRYRAELKRLRGGDAAR